MFYQILSSSPLFLCDFEDNIDEIELLKLARFSNDLKSQKLAKICDKGQRNLISQILEKDAGKRLALSRVLQHPYITNSTHTRLIGEDPGNFHTLLLYNLVFLIYSFQHIICGMSIFT